VGVNTTTTGSQAQLGNQNIYLFSATPHPDAIHINSLDFDFFQPKIDFSQYDYLILTSKKAVDALLFYEKEEYIHIPALCISRFTQEYYESKGGKVLEIGGGIGSDLKKIIGNYSKEKKWLYLRAKKIAGDGFGVDEVILYESRCSGEILDFKLHEKASTLIFTSPSSIQCFLTNNTIPKDAKVVVIGKTTAKYLPKDQTYLLAKTSSIEECIKISNEDFVA